MKHTVPPLVVSLLLALACGGGSDNPPLEKPPEPLKSVQDGGPDFPRSVSAAPTPLAGSEAPQGFTSGLCRAGERTRLSCDVKGNKTLSVCEGNNTLTYRFGTSTTLDLELPKAGSEKDVTLSRRVPGSDREIVVYGFWNEGHRYAAEVVRTEDQFEGRVIVRRGVKKLSVVLCTGDVSADLTDQSDAFKGDPSDRWSWIGSWSSGDNAINIDGKGLGLAITEAEAFWIGANPGQVHTGEAAGPLTKAGKTYRYSTDGCEMTLTPAGPDRMTVEDNLGCGGLNVSFSGEYHRTP